MRLVVPHGCHEGGFFICKALGLDIYKVTFYSKSVSGEITKIALQFISSPEIVKITSLNVFLIICLIQTGFFLFWGWCLKCLRALNKVFVLSNSELLFFQIQRSASLGASQISQKVIPLLELKRVEDGKRKPL